MKRLAITNATLKEKYSFKEFVDYYDRFIWKKARYYNIPNMTTEDIRQEILQIFWRVYNTYDNSKSSITNYIIVAINYRISALLKKVKATDQYLDKEVYNIERMDIFRTNENIQRSDKQKHLHKQIWDYINTLKHAKTARYYYIGGMTLERIAEIEKISNQGVDSRLKTIRRKVQKKFGKILYDFFT